MSYTKEQRFDKAYNAVIDYVAKNGKNLKDGLIVWDTFPICVQDVCYDKIVIKDGKIFACHNDDSFEDWRDISLINYRYVQKIVPDMQRRDAKIKKK